jgi:hypothetical protein
MLKISNILIMARDLEYEINNVGYDWFRSKDTGGGIKCKNYELCECILPKWWFECKGNYLCTSCHMMFGTWGRGENRHTGKGILPIVDNFECPICLETTKGISQPRCDHSVCIRCFKRCYFGDETCAGEPEFPYPEMEDDYYDDPKNPKWKIDYPLIKIYNAAHNKWQYERDEKYTNETYLRMCPLCRK